MTGKSLVARTVTMHRRVYARHVTEVSSISDVFGKLYYNLFQFADFWRYPRRLINFSNPCKLVLFINFILRVTFIFTGIQRLSFSKHFSTKKEKLSNNVWKFEFKILFWIPQVVEKKSVAKKNNISTIDVLI